MKKVSFATLSLAFFLGCGSAPQPTSAPAAGSAPTANSSGPAQVKPPTAAGTAQPVKAPGPAKSPDDKTGNADKVIETKNLKGTFLGFETGDYQHAIIKTAKGEDMSFFLPADESLAYFLVAMKGKPLELTYEIVDAPVPEAGRVQAIERLTDAKADGLNYQAWWKKELAGGKEADLRRKYQDLIDKATR